MAQHLAALLMDKFRHMSKQTLPLAEIQKGIATDTGMDVGPALTGAVTIGVVAVVLQAQAWARARA